MRSLADVVSNQKLLAMPPDTTVRDACREMRERRVGSVAVVNPAGRLIGLFTGRDAVCRVVAEGMNPVTTQLAEVMTVSPETISPDASPVDALRMMWDGGFRHLPLVRGGRILGIVSRGDFKGLEHNVHDRERELWERMR